MRKFTTILISLFLLQIAIVGVAQSQTVKTSTIYNIDANSIDLQPIVKERLIRVVRENSCSITKHYTIKGAKSVNIVYNTSDSIKVVNVGVDKSSVKSSSIMVDSSKLTLDDFSFIYLPKRRYNSIMASSCSEGFSHLVSLDDGSSWSRPHNSDFHSATPVIYVHRRRDGILISYFFGNSNFTSPNNSGKSMLMMSHSENGGQSWSLPEIAVKHNIYSIDSGTMAFYYNKNDKKAYKNILYAVFNDKISGKAFYSVSNDDGEKWSYPIEIEILKNTHSYSLSIYKNHFAFTFSQSKRGDNMDNVYLYLAKTKDFFKKRKTTTFFKLYSFDRSRCSDYCVNSLLYRPDKLLLTIGNKWDNNIPSYLRIGTVDVKTQPYEEL